MKLMGDFHPSLTSSIAMIVVIASMHDALANQQDDIACGPNSLRVAARLLDCDVADQDLEAAFQGPLTGSHSFIQIEDAAEALGLAIRWIPSSEGQQVIGDLPMIAMVRDNESQYIEGTEATDGHFVVLYGHVGNKVQVLDYPNGPLFIEQESLSRKWSGGAICVGRSWRDFALNVDRPRWLAGGVSLACIAAAVTCIYLAKTSRNSRQNVAKRMVD